MANPVITTEKLRNSVSTPGLPEFKEAVEIKFGEPTPRTSKGYDFNVYSITSPEGKHNLADFAIGRWKVKDGDQLISIGELADKKAEDENVKGDSFMIMIESCKVTNTLARVPGSDELKKDGKGYTIPTTIIHGKTIDEILKPQDTAPAAN